MCNVFKSKKKLKTLKKVSTNLKVQVKNLTKLKYFLKKKKVLPNKKKLETNERNYKVQVEIKSAFLSLLVDISVSVFIFFIDFRNVTNIYFCFFVPYLKDKKCKNQE